MTSTAQSQQPVRWIPAWQWLARYDRAWLRAISLLASLSRLTYYHQVLAVLRLPG